MTTIRELREAHGMSRNALAKAVPLQHYRLVKVEAGELLLTPNAARKTAAIFGVEVEEVEELRAAVEKEVEVKVPFSLPPCQLCGKQRTSPDPRRRTPYCSPCETRVRATGRLKKMDSPLPQAFYRAFIDARITVQECCREIEFPIPTFWRWMEGRGRTPQLQKLLKFVVRLDATYLIETALETTGLQMPKFTIMCPRCPVGQNTKEDYTTEIKGLDGKRLDSMNLMDLTAVGLCHVHNGQVLGERRVEDIKADGVWIVDGSEIWFKNPGPAIREEHDVKWVHEKAALKVWANHARSFQPKKRRPESLAKMKSSLQQRKELIQASPEEAEREAARRDESLMKQFLRKLDPKVYSAEFLAQWVPFDATPFHDYERFAQAVQMKTRFYQGETLVALGRSFGCADRTVSNRIRMLGNDLLETGKRGEWGQALAHLCKVLNWAKDFKQSTHIEWRRLAELRKPRNARRSAAPSLAQPMEPGTLTDRQRMRDALSNGPKHLSELVELTGLTKGRLTRVLNRHRGDDFLNLTPGQRDPLWSLLIAGRL